MRLIASLFLVASCSSALVAQTFPEPKESNPRIQTVQWRESEPIVLTALPESTLTVILEPGESVSRATLTGNTAWDVKVPAERNSLQITPEAGALASNLSVLTDARAYDFFLEIDPGLMAAYVVELRYDSSQTSISPIDEVPTEGLTWGYRLRGDREVRPLSIRDNGEKTVITYAPDQSLPAVFAIGPTGDEEVVDGYMRGDLFVIDRVHRELVFRINRDKATAKRNRREDEEQ